jgi:hypothetical protein
MRADQSASAALNYLTADNCRRVVAAECQTGERTQLDWSLDNMVRGKPTAAADNS